MKYKAPIKLVLSIVMLVMVLRLVELKNLKEVILSVPLSTALLVFFFYTLGQFVSAFKWWTIARSGGISVSFMGALRAYFIGMFVNCFGFGTIGGDVARALLLTDGKTSRATALGSVAADRVHGLSVLACIALLAFVFSSSQALDSTLLAVIIVLPAGVVLGWAFGPPILFKFLPAGSRLGDLARQVFQVFPRDPKTVLFITVLSTCLHILQIYLHMVIAEGLGVHIPWSVLLTTIPFVSMLTSLPISWNGLGLRENAYRAFLVPAFLTNEQAITMGAVWLLGVVLASSIGGIFSVLSKDSNALENAQKAISAAANDKVSS